MDNSCIIEGNVKFRDGKKWKSRWCVMRKLSPVADCLHLQLYGDSKDRYKQGQTKASLSLQHFLGVQSGFTLDKESNTIAVICQDVTVVLAFDTRERLIQWQVKISNNLGEDQKFLILISSAPSKAKLPNGPAYLHIQDYRFCIVVGVPVRLVGVWEIAQLRRYGVVEGRFCFEGGSRCGRGEGLHVLKTDQGDDLVKTFQLAAEGKLATRKRCLGREPSGQDSPRRQFSVSEARAGDFFPVSTYSTYPSFEETCESYKNENLICWSSTESRQDAVDGDFRDASSVSELTEQQEQWHNCSYSRHGTASLERCASCISKLGTLSKSSTAATTVVNSGLGVTSNSPGPAMSSSTHSQPRAFDRLSLSSYSSSSHDSDYSMSQHADSLYSTVSKNFHTARRSSPSPLSLPPRPPKPKNPNQSNNKTKKAPMPLPDDRKICECSQKQSVSRSNSSSYENYDVPKSIRGLKLEQQEGYYDTPKKIKECLALQRSYANYDMPHVPQAVVLQQCGCPARLNAQVSRSSICPCQNMMSWAGFVLPYCRRGAGIEPTTVTVQPVKLSGEGKMPVVNASGACFYNNLSTPDKENCEINYENIESVHSVIDTQPKSVANYANLNFEQSLEYYENSKELIAKSKAPQEPAKTETPTPVEEANICCECHYTRKPEPCKIITKSSSNPSLSRSRAQEKSRKRPRKRSYSAESTQFFDDISSSDMTIHKCPSESMKKIEDVSNLASSDEFRNFSETVNGLRIRRSSSVPSKASSHNRDSSGSNDSGVSEGSLGNQEFAKKTLSAFAKDSTMCFHSSLPRKSRDHFRETSIQFQRATVSTKSNSVEGDIPKGSGKGFRSPGENSAPAYTDSRSTSSGTSDMSDYIETLSLSSHSSSDAAADVLRMGGRTVTTTLRPRSGKEYYKIDRSILDEQRRTKGRATSSSNYANITPVLEKSESPSPGYVSSSPFEQPQQPGTRERFLFPEVRDSLNEASL